MYEDLEPIANLKYGQVIERVSREQQGQLSAEVAKLAAHGLSSSSPVILAKLTSAVNTCERARRGLHEIWLELILQRNRNSISREDVDFIMAKVNACAQGQTGHIAQALATPGQPAPEWAVQRAQTQMQSVTSNIGRELEIKLREQEAFRSRTGSPDSSFFAFLHAFGEGWLTLMSGPATVPFAILALFAPGHYKLLFAALAIICGVFSSYQVWRNERTRSR